MDLTVKRTGRTWGAFDAHGVLIEGGFFSRDAAIACAAEHDEAAYQRALVREYDRDCTALYPTHRLIKGE